ncbi:MAG: SDR family oxidoreductase [Bacillota bacterium]
MHVRDLFDLSGRVALVTGGSMGLGKQMARGLAEAGADLVLCSRKDERLREAARELGELGVRVLPLPGDVGDPEAVQRVVEGALAAFGHLDILVNAAGLAWAGPPERLPLPDWEKVQRTNVTGTFLMCQAVGRHMIERRRGSIINVASVAGLLGTAVLDAIAYNTSKGAVIAFTRDLAVKWAGYGVRVNAIAPGFFPTHMTDWVIRNRGREITAATPLGRLGGDDDLKGAVVYLASEASAYVTGHVLVVDGGLVAGR